MSDSATEMRPSKASVFSKQKFKVKGKLRDKGGLVFKNNRVFVCALVLSIMETFSLQRVFMSSRQYQGVTFLFPFAIMFLFLGLPLLLSQLFLGQYAGAGILKLWRLAPFASGLGFSMLIICIIKMIAKCRHSSILLLCVIYTLAASDQWTNCKYVKEGNACFVTEPDNATKAIMEKKCCETDLNEFNVCPTKSIVFLPFSANARLAAEFFDKQFSMYEFGFGPINLYLMATLAVIWTLVFVALYRGVRILNKVVLPVSVVLGLMFVVMLFSVFIGGGKNSLYGMEYFFEIKPEAFLKVELWTNCVEIAFEMLHMLCGPYVIYGSFAPRTANPISATVTVGIIKIFTIVLVVAMHTAISGSVAKLLDVPLECLHNVGWSIVYANPPQFFGSLQWPQVWTFLYFFYFFAMDLSYIIMMLFAVVESVFDLKPKLREYDLYIVLAITLCSFLLGLPLVTQAGSHINRTILMVTLAVGDVLLTCYSAVIMVLYGVQRLADDVYFYMGKPPSKFWVYMWYLSPVPMVIVLLPEAYGVFEKLPEIDSNVLQPMYLGVSILILCPIPIAAIYQLRFYIKASRILSAFVPTRDWGMVDKDERKRRLHFNPHKIIRFKSDAPLKHRPAGLLSKKHIKMENDRLENHRKIFLEYLKAKEESAATGGEDVPLPPGDGELRDGRTPEPPDSMYRGSSIF